MTDEYIRRQDMIDLWDKYHATIAVDAIEYDMRLKRLPSADVVPVRHGKWTHKPDVYGVVYCSECNYELHANSTSFCPNCGAKMDGGEDENG